MVVPVTGPARAARRGMFWTSGQIDTVKDARPVDRVALADRRTSMCDYRIALSVALGRPCDRNGFTLRAGAGR